MTLYPRHRIDIGFDDLGFAARACLERGDRGLEAGRALEAEWEAVVCLSVRSAFDLYLSALALPRGSEVITTALTIPGMLRVLEEHGLLAVPVDLDPRTLAPEPAWVEAAITPRTRAVLVAHLMGGRLDLAPIAALARAHRLVLIEDLAQGFTGPGWKGHPEAEISMFSFGSIKTATALGGAIAVVRNPQRRAAMAAAQAHWPVQPVGQYAQKVARTLALSSARGPVGYAVLAKGCDLTGRPLEEVLNAVTRGFADPAALLAGIRRRPCGPLQALLHRRIHRFDHSRFERRAAAGEALTQALGAGTTVVGVDQPERSHWLFAVTVSDPAALIAWLHRRGFDATRAATSLSCVGATDERAPAQNVIALLQQLVFLPVWPEIPEADRARLAVEVRTWATEHSRPRPNRRT